MNTRAYGVTALKTLSIAVENEGCAVQGVRSMQGAAYSPHSSPIRVTVSGLFAHGRHGAAECGPPS